MNSSYIVCTLFRMHNADMACKRKQQVFQQDFIILSFCPHAPIRITFGRYHYLGNSPETHIYIFHSNVCRCRVYGSRRPRPVPNCTKTSSAGMFALLCRLYQISSANLSSDSKREKKKTFRFLYLGIRYIFCFIEFARSAVNCELTLEIKIHKSQNV